MDNWILTGKDLEEYIAKCGLESGINLLLLVSPDGFVGDYDKTLDRLTTELTTNQCTKTSQNDIF